MGMISGGFGLKKFFEDSDREKAGAVPASETLTPKPDGAQVRLTDLDCPFLSIFSNVTGPYKMKTFNVIYELCSVNIA